MDTQAPDAVDSMMQQVQERLRALFLFPEGEEPFKWLLMCWRRFTKVPVVLTWERHGSASFAWWNDFALKIESGPARSREMRLRFRWPRGGSRVVGRGDPATLKAMATRICEAGGPHGAPCLPDDEPPRPGRPRRHVHLARFTRMETHERALVEGFGAGYQARVRPLGVDLNGPHGLFLVSPKGSFVLVELGPIYTMAALAEWARGNISDEFAPDLHDGDDPFVVRVRGVPFRLEYARIPGFGGYAQTPVGEVFLVLLGPNDVALVRVAEDGAPQCLFRGTVREANGHELLPDEVPLALLQRPKSFTPEKIAAAIASQPKLNPVINRHLVELVRDARDEVGTESARHLVWALVVAHARGLRTRVSGTHAEIFRWVLDQGHTPVVPKDRAARGALHWLAARSPLFERSVVKRVAHWKCRVEWFSEPSAACLARVVALETAPH